VGLIAWRGDRLRAPGRIDSPVSREGAFLANNVLFAAFAFVVLLGTVFPLVVEAVNGDRISVGPPYFERMTMPIGLTLLFLMAVAPVLPWRKASTELLAQRLQWPMWAGVGAVVVAVVLGARGLAPLLAFGLGGFAGGAAVRQLVLASRRQGWRGVVGRTNGGMVVHLGVIVIAVALAASSSYLRQGEFTLEPGDSIRFAGHDITYVEPSVDTTARTTELEALVLIDGHGPYAPALTRFDDAGMSVATPSVRSTVTEDVHLSLSREPNGDTGAIQLRVTVQPLVVWLWIGGAVIVGGSILALFPGSRRRPTAPVSVPTAVSVEPVDEAPRDPVGVA
jgi:cytochrome c-type biogenesis protein CcmF